MVSSGGAVGNGYPERKNSQAAECSSCQIISRMFATAIGALISEVREAGEKKEKERKTKKEAKRGVGGGEGEVGGLTKPPREIRRKKRGCLKEAGKATAGRRVQPSQKAAEDDGKESRSPRKRAACVQMSTYQH